MAILFVFARDDSLLTVVKVMEELTEGRLEGEFKLLTQQFVKISLVRWIICPGSG